MDKAELFCDGDRGSFWHSGAYGEPGDWYGVDYGMPIPVRSVEVLMGRNDKDGDYVEKGQLEGSRDLKTWKPLGPETSGMQVAWKAPKPVLLRAVRYRVIEPKKTDNGRAVWTAVREIAVNTPPSAMAASNVAGLEGVSVQKSDKIVRINRVMETHKMKPGEFISLQLDGPTDATWLEVNLERDDVNSWAEVVLDVENVTMHSAQHKKDAVRNVSFQVHAGEIVCLAGIEGNGQTEFVYGLTGLEKISSGKITLDGKDITNESIRQRSKDGMSHIPEDRHKHGLVLDYSLENNMVLQRYWQPEFQKGGFIRSDKVREYSDKLIAQYDVRSGQGSLTTVRSMSGGNQQKAIIAREIDKDPKLLVAVQPTRGLDVGAIEYIHRQIVAERDKGTAVLLVSLELDEVMNLSDRILVMYEGEVVGEFDPKTTTVQELGLYMAGARKQGKESK